jgi:hypothetical protein
MWQTLPFLMKAQRQLKLSPCVVGKKYNSDFDNKKAVNN